MAAPLTDMHEEPFWQGQLDFRLPPELIAQRPAHRREDARLMVVERASGRIEHASVRDLPEKVDVGDLIVGNDSRVFPARLRGRKATGGRVELLLLAADAAGPVPALSGTSKPLRPGQQIRFAEDVVCTVTALEGAGRCLVDFGPTPLTEVIERLGEVPLPPYIDRSIADEQDRERYQTVYAGPAGSVAAPTAGLHLSEDGLRRLREKGVEFQSLTLHVGPGTFIPIRAQPEHHRMQAERFRIPERLVRAVADVRAANRRVVAVGTTTVRALESAVGEEGSLRVGEGDAGLFIRPGYRFRVVDALMTNFHLPNSTLLCLVMALTGEDLLREAYEVAVREGYRFYSYGDAMLIV